LLAIALAMPFILVRLIYSAVFTFSGNTKFSSTSGDESILLGMSVIMEAIAVVIFEAIGITLNKIPKPIVADVEGNRPYSMSRLNPDGSSPSKPEQPSRGKEFLAVLGRRTIIGRLLTSSRR